MKRLLALGLALAFGSGLPDCPPAFASVECYSRAALPVLASRDVPELWLAQRTIDREWGRSDDSTYVEVDVKGWKSEGAALGLSAALPGAGQLYVGEGSGWWFLFGEAAGWAGRWYLRDKGQAYREQAGRFVGDPYDSTSAWSFARYQYWTSGADVTRLQQLYASDRESFYQALTADPALIYGYAGNQPEKTYDIFRDLRATSDDQLRRSRWVEAALWAHHLVAAWDALRAAHFHNLPLQQELRLKVGGRPGHPDLRAALVRRF